MKEQTKEVANPGLSDPNFTRDKFVKRWVSWSKDFIKIAGSLDRAASDVYKRQGRGHALLFLLR